MESNESLLNNDLQVDATAHGHLSETAKWAKFMAIAGFIFSLAILVFALYYATMLANMRSSFGDSGSARMGATFISIFYTIVALVWALISMYHFRFATKLQLALQVNDQVELNNALRNLRMYYRISGIVTIISLLFTVLGVVGVLMSLPGKGF
ncbi:MAG TPA: DUF5362 family protein [Ferruginibacter sp.]|nr:DUF5362 family protein [Ferruginibacter sp.]